MPTSRPASKDPIKTVEAYYDRFARNDPSWAQVVAEDVVFDGPVDQGRSRDELAAINARFLPTVAGFELLHRSAAGNGVASRYRFDLRKPDGGTLACELMEMVEVEDGRIRSFRVFYDPRAFLEAFAAEPQADAGQGAA